MTAKDGEPVDITMIGGGPTGLFGVFYAGMRGASARVIDTLPELGGQLRALYPEKHIYDVAGFPKIRAKTLCERLIEQGLQFGPDVRLGERAEGLSRENGSFVVETDRGAYPTRTVIIAGGKGAFEPRRLDAPGFDRFWKRGVWSHVEDPEALRGQRVLIVGGGDSAFDWSLALSEIARRVVHIHRSDRFRAHEHTVHQVEAAVADGTVELLTHHEVREIHGSEAVERVTIYDDRTEDERCVDVDVVLSLIGFKPDIGPLADWGFEVAGRTIRVDARMMTSLPGVYAAGDIARHDGNLELLATAFGEVAVAVNHAVHRADPDARVNPGHSTSMSVFQDRYRTPTPTEAS